MGATALAGGLGALPSAQAAEPVEAVAAAPAEADAVSEETTPPPAPEPISAPALGSSPALGGSADTCLTQTICAVKERIRWQAPAWTPSQCRRIANAVANSAKKHDLSPSLLLAVMVNESDMNEKAAHVYTRGGKVYAKDGGLMAIRCMPDARERCTNGNVRGVPWRDIMDPVKNIELGARELARWRDGGGVTEKTIVKLDAQGHRQKVTKYVPCKHKTHAYWAHYNHGPRYIDHGYPRHYPHRVAVIDHAFATVMNTPAPELETGRITMHDPGRRERTIDHPLEPRYKKLYEQILSQRSCSPLALN
jgi:hypothetical protein